jgi:hypothetical protein
MSGTGPAWTVISQSETMGIGPNGGAGSGVKVTFRLADGTTGSVFVPDAQYTAENVKAAISARVDVLTAVKGLAP